MKIDDSEQDISVLRLECPCSLPEISLLRQEYYIATHYLLSWLSENKYFYEGRTSSRSHIQRVFLKPVFFSLLIKLNNKLLIRRFWKFFFFFFFDVSSGSYSLEMIGQWGFFWVIPSAQAVTQNTKNIQKRTS